MEALVQALKEFFPGHSNTTILAVLQSQNGDLERAAEALVSMPEVTHSRTPEAIEPRYNEPCRTIKPTNLLKPTKPFKISKTHQTRSYILPSHQKQGGPHTTPLLFRRR